MTVTKVKKSKKMRSKSSHGWGCRKKHRGAGNRGGRGMAGTGKRADQKKISILKQYGLSYFGQHGFKIPKKAKLKRIVMAINIKDLPERDTINLAEQGIQKLLAKGTPTRKYKITVEQCSPRAKEKIEKAGGQVTTK